MKTVRETMPSASGLEESVKCTRCKNIHKYGDRVMVQDKKETYKGHITCPRCGGRVTVKPPEIDIKIHNSKKMSVAVRSVSVDWFELMEEFLQMEIRKFLGNGIQRHKIRVYIPSYIIKMYESWVYQYRLSLSDSEGHKEVKVFGVQITENWDNTIVVSFEDIQLHDELLPAILKIP